MHHAYVILQLLVWLLAFAWLSMLLAAARGLPTVPNLLDPTHDLAQATLPSLAVIVPARNEAANIAATLQSLISQDAQPSSDFHIVAVDDRSTDATRSIIDSFAGIHPSIVASLHIDALPSGWLGKTHAMSLAARFAIDTHAPAYLLFTDADIVFAPSILRRALANVAATDADHLVVMPTTIIKTPGEAMLLSFFQVLGLFAVRTWRVASPTSRDAIGVGAFNLVRTSAYRQIGGFEAEPMEIVEDLALGRRLKRAGLRQRVAFAPGAVSVHWASSTRGILNNMTKNLFAIFRFQPILLLGASAWLAIFSLAPIWFLLQPLAHAVPVTRLPALIACASVAGLYSLSSRTSRISPWYAVLYPVSAVLLIYSMLRSMLITLAHGGVTWRGTFYPLATLRNPPPAPPLP